MIGSWFFRFVFCLTRWNKGSGCFFCTFSISGYRHFLSRFSCVLIFSVLPCFVPEYSSRGLEVGGVGEDGTSR